MCTILQMLFTSDCCFYKNYPKDKKNVFGALSYSKLEGS